MTSELRIDDKIFHLIHRFIDDKKEYLELVQSQNLGQCTVLTQGKTKGYWII